MNNLIVRTLSGLGLVVLIITSVWYDSFTNFLLFFVVLLIGLKEFYAMAFKNRSKGNLLYTFGLALGIYVLSFLVAHNVLPFYSFLIVIPLFLLLPIEELYSKEKQPIINIALKYYGIIYLSLPLALIPFMLVKNTGTTEQLTLMSQWNNSLEATYYYPNLLLGIFIMQWLSDTGAYLFGMTFGKRKLFQRISPNKSWEGALGGLLSTIGASFICYYFLGSLDWIHWLVIALIIAVFGIYGDLIESLFKRSVQTKDSGSILPGHGGILDRFDSAFVSIPLVFFYVKMITFMA